MNLLCEKLHAEFSKLKPAQEESRQALQHYAEQGGSTEEVKAAVDNLTQATIGYETFCKTAQQLPNGCAIWLPDYLAIVNLAELNEIGRGSILRKITEEGVNPQSTRLLKLDLSHSNITLLGNTLSPLRDLQVLALGSNRRLSDLGKSLDDLVNLQKLYLNGCTGLSDLGTSLNNLVNLKILDLGDCDQLADLGRSLENLVSLQSLSLIGCSNLTDLGRSLDNLVNLRVLNLWFSTGLSDLGKSLDNLVNLQKLILESCTSLTSLGSFSDRLTKLVSVDIRDCNALSDSEKQRLKSIPNCKVVEG